MSDNDRIRARCAARNPYEAHPATANLKCEQGQFPGPAQNIYPLSSAKRQRHIAFGDDDSALTKSVDHHLDPGSGLGIVGSEKKYVHLSMLSNNIPCGFAYGKIS